MPPHYYTLAGIGLSLALHFWELLFLPIYSFAWGIPFYVGTLKVQREMGPYILSKLPDIP